MGRSYEGLWLAASGALVALAGVLLGVNATLISSHPQGFWTSGLTVVAYVLGLLAVVCFVGAMKRWPMPLTGHRRVISDQVRQTVDKIVNDWRSSGLRRIDFATDPDISDVVASSKRHRRFMGDRQPDLVLQQRFEMPGTAGVMRLPGAGLAAASPG